MKQRVISACVGLLILLVILLFFNTLVLNAAVAAIVMLALLELLHAAGCGKERVLVLISCLYGGCVPFIPYDRALQIFAPVTFLYISVLLLVMIIRHNKISAMQIGFTFFVSLLIPFSLTVSVYMRDQKGVPCALLLILIALGSAWLSDTGAFFAGRAFGKHALAPQISPKKTVEGAIGGAIFCEIFMLLIALLYRWGAQVFFDIHLEVNFLLIALLLPFLSGISILGDLSASVIKRQNHIKDYGHIMPGHGGVVDRFDSVFFTVPTVFILTQFFALVRIL